MSLAFNIVPTTLRAWAKRGKSAAAPHPPPLSQPRRRSPQSVVCFLDPKAPTPRVDELKEAARALHSDAQLQGRMWVATTAGSPTRQGVVRYMAELRGAYRILSNRLPEPLASVAVEAGAAVERDLFFLVASEHTPDPPFSNSYLAYSGYVSNLSYPEAVSHFYNLLFAHLAGGGRTVADTIAPVLPASFMQHSEYFAKLRDRVNLPVLRAELEACLEDMSPGERLKARLEIPVAFAKITALLHLLYLYSE